MSLRVHQRLRREIVPQGYVPLRLGIIGAAALLWIAGLGGRLYHLQVIEHPHYQAVARDQQERLIDEHPPRGEIVDARGRQLAVSIEVDTVFADPRLMRERGVDLDSASERLAAVLGVGQTELRKQFDDPSSFVYLARRVSAERAEAVRALKITGVDLLPENQRVYPMGQVAAHVLGFVGADNVGLAGLESRYQEQIAGTPAPRLLRRDARGKMVVVPTALGSQAVPGADLVLTIDARIQNLAEQHLAEAVAATGSRAGSIVLLDPRDASILALASYPTFDPNRWASSEPAQRRNRPVMDAFEPGSTFKMVTAAAALDSLSVHPDDRFDCEMGGMQLHDAYIRDHKPFGVLTFREVLANSSNVGVIKAALRTGPERLQSQVQEFGFGERTGIDLPGESAGIVRRAERWNRMSTAYASFGHGISVTSLQMANAYASLISGARHEPHVVRALRIDGREQPLARAAAKPLQLEETTRRELLRLLENVVANGTGSRAAVDGYLVGGKTGTAQKSDSRGYSARGRVASFIGFVPAREPRLVGMVTLDEPASTPSGGLLAAPVFSALARDALFYLGVLPQVEEWQRADNVLRFDPPPRSQLVLAARGEG